MVPVVQVSCRCYLYEGFSIQAYLLELLLKKQTPSYRRPSCYCSLSLFCCKFSFELRSEDDSFIDTAELVVLSGSDLQFAL